MLPLAILKFQKSTLYAYCLHWCLQQEPDRFQSKPVIWNMYLAGYGAAVTGKPTLLQFPLCTWWGGNRKLLSSRAIKLKKMNYVLFEQFYACTFYFWDFALFKDDADICFKCFVIASSDYINVNQKQDIALKRLDKTVFTFNLCFLSVFIFLHSGIYDHFFNVSIEF